MMDLNSMNEQEIYTALTSIEGWGLRPKITPSKGNKISFDAVLKNFRGGGIDFSEFFDLHSNLDTKKRETVVAYNSYVHEHPLIELLGKFIQAGLLDKDLNHKEHYFIPLGDELLTKPELRRLNLCEGVILRNGDFLPIRHKDAHKIGSMWLYLHGYRLDNAVRYTSSYLGEPYFSSMSDFVERSTNAIAISGAQAVAMCNILIAKYPEVKSFPDKFREFTDLCMMPGADSDCMLSNIQKLQDLLGRDRFDAHAVITDIRQEAMAMGIVPSTLCSQPGAED